MSKEILSVLCDKLLLPLDDEVDEEYLSDPVNHYIADMGNLECTGAIQQGPVYLFDTKFSQYA